MVIWGLRLIGAVLLLYSIAALLAFVLYPLVKALGRVVGRRVAALLVMALVVAAAVALIYWLGMALVEQGGVLADRLAFLTQPDAIQQIPWLAHVLQSFGVDPSTVRIPVNQWIQEVGGWLRQSRRYPGWCGLCADQCRRGDHHHDVSAHGWRRD